VQGLAPSAEVDGAATRDRRQPGSGAIRDAGVGPRGEGRRVCVLDALFGLVDVDRDHETEGRPGREDVHRRGREWDDDATERHINNRHPSRTITPTNNGSWR